MDEGLYHIHCGTSRYMYGIVFCLFCVLESIYVSTHQHEHWEPCKHGYIIPIFHLTTSSLTFPIHFPPMLTHIHLLLQWAEIHPAPPVSSSVAGAPRAASSPPYFPLNDPHDSHSAHQTAASGDGARQSSSLSSPSFSSRSSSSSSDDDETSSANSGSGNASASGSGNPHPLPPFHHNRHWHASPVPHRQPATH